MRFATEGLLSDYPSRVSPDCRAELRTNLTSPFRPSLHVYAFGAGVVAVSNAGGGRESLRGGERGGSRKGGRGKGP